MASYKHIWPIDKNAANPPYNWAGWPEGKKFALILTHDVDTEKGQEKCMRLAEIEKSFGFRSSFNFVPERYAVSDELRTQLTDEFFEVGVHGLSHDGKLFSSKDIFEQRALKINKYLADWNSTGFRAPVMHHNLDWIHALNIEYDLSTFDTDPFEPQNDGVCTIFPFWVSNASKQNGYVEMPYTLPQDFTLFVIMKEQSNRIWRDKLDWVASKGGMVLLNSHPDYMKFGKESGAELYPVEYYRDFLEYITTEYKDQFWHALPHEMAYFWKNTMVLNNNVS